MLDLDDILPTMLVCRQFFACKHLTILCKDLSGFILGNLKDYSLDDMKLLNGICANNIIFVIVFNNFCLRHMILFWLYSFMTPKDSQNPTVC